MTENDFIGYAIFTALGLYVLALIHQFIIVTRKRNPRRKPTTITNVRYNMTDISRLK